MCQVSPAEKRQLDAEWRDYTTQIRSLQANVDELQHEKEGTRRNLNTIMGVLSCAGHVAFAVPSDAGALHNCTRCGRCHACMLGVLNPWVLGVSHTQLIVAVLSLRSADRLQQRQSVKGRRLALLNERSHGIADAFKWVQANGHQFKGPVFGPLICEVGVDNPLHADMLEQSVRGAVLASLVPATRRSLLAGFNCTGWTSIARPASWASYCILVPAADLKRCIFADDSAQTAESDNGLGQSSFLV